MTSFSDKEWSLADTIHFGSPGGWDEESCYIRAVDEGKIVGMIHYILKAGVLEIATLIVSHKYRNRGIGRSLIEKVENIGKKKGIHKLFLLTGKGWKEVDFYKKMGFIQTGELKKHHLKRDWLELSKFIE